MNWLGEFGEKYLGWTRETYWGKALDEWADIFQPMHDDFEKMGYSEATVKELEEAWGTIPPDLQKKILKVIKLIRKWLGVKVATDFTEWVIGKLKVN